uniref:VHS domain-containing protein n=1 Tax=Xiphophorus couchianus TaxID=32473 RepID=A0A3B5M8D4_9TELE
VAIAISPPTFCIFSFSDKATNPSNRQEDWEYIMGFCDQINKELEGPQISVRLLAHKIQSPQEWEAMQALTVLEACMKNCGRRFHNEVGKFKFLNELIKVVSPKVSNINTHVLRNRDDQGCTIYRVAVVVTSICAVLQQQRTPLM